MLARHEHEELNVDEVFRLEFGQFVADASAEVANSSITVPGHLRAVAHVESVESPMWRSGDERGQGEHRGCDLPETCVQEEDLGLVAFDVEHLAQAELGMANAVPRSKRCWRLARHPWRDSRPFFMTARTIQWAAPAPGLAAVRLPCSRLGTGRCAHGLRFPESRRGRRRTRCGDAGA